MMRRILCCMLSTLLLLTAGCGAPAEEGAKTAPEAGVQTEPGEIAPPDTSEPTEAPEGLTLELERPVYDPSLTEYVYFVRSNTEETLHFGESYRIQRLSEDAWLDLTPRENWAFTAIGYILEPGEEIALTCTLDMYKEPPEPGLYRLLKDLGGGTLAAEFSLGDSPYTAETPYGFQPLESLPETYGADMAADTDVVFTYDGGRNLAAVEEFLYKVRAHVPCQLRVVQDYGEGAAMVTDTVYDENWSILWRLRSGGTVTERRFSYVVTDGQALYLSNGADWASGDQYKDLRTLLIPEAATEEMVSTVEKMTSSRLAGNSIRYRVWSPDGLWDAALTDVPTEFTVSFRDPAGGWAEVLDVQNWDGLETAVTALSWQADGTLLLTCETSIGGTGKLFFDPETKRMTSGELCGLPLAEDAVSDPSEH